MMDKEEAKKQTQLLVELRRQHSESVKHTQELLKNQQAVRQSLLKALQHTPRTVPQLAAAASMQAHEVLWHIAAMKKYGIVEEAGMDDNGDYYLYKLTGEVSS